MWKKSAEYLVLVTLLSLSDVNMQTRTPAYAPIEPVFFPPIWQGLIEVGQNNLNMDQDNVSVMTCEGQLALYVDGLVNKIPWAIEMYDATGKQGPGLVRGSVTWHGDFHQCLSVRHPLPVSNISTTEDDYVTGQYCSALFEVPKWLAQFIKDQKLPFDVHLPSLTVDLCVPATCTEEHIQTFVEQYLAKHNGTNHTLYEMRCHKTPEIRDDVAAIFSTAVLLLIAMCVVFGTMIHTFLSITTPHVEETAATTIGFRQRAASLLSRAGSIFSRQNSMYSVHDEQRRKRGSIFSLRSSTYKKQASNMSTNSRDMATQSEETAANLATSADAVSYNTEGGDVTSIGSSRSLTELSIIGKDDVSVKANNPVDMVQVKDESKPKGVLQDGSNDLAGKDKRGAVAKSGKHTKKPSVVRTSNLGPIKELQALKVVEPQKIVGTVRSTLKKHIGHSIADVFLCFSIQRNLQRILGEGNPDYLFCLNGVRVLSITWIVLGNTISFLYREPNIVANIVEVPEATQRFIFQVVINSTFAADTFFILSGTLLAYHWMKQAEKGKKFTVKDLLMMYLHRFIRIAPCYYVLIMMYTNLLPYFGEGPRWKYTSPSIQQCKDHWWANALFISNFYKADDMCMPWTYYLVNDFQFYIISPIVLIPLSKFPPLAFVLIILLILTQIVSTAVLNNNINGNILRMTGGFFENIYAKPYCRVGVFAIGIALGYAIFKAGRRVYFRKTPLMFGWCVALCTTTVLVFITYDENQVGGTHWTGTQTAVYEAVSRPAWGLGVSWMIFCCCIGQGGFVNKILSWNMFLPLCRITYGIYLLHPMLIVLVLDTSKTLIYIDIESLLTLFVFILVISTSLALLFMSTVEGPMVRLESLLLRHKRK